MDALPVEATFESRSEEWEVRGIPKTGKTIPRHREERMHSLKSGEHLGLFKKGGQRGIDT